jgi:uroporphyrinogen decarboxylase
MTSREIIKRNLEFTKPERIGISFERGRRSDMLGAAVDLAGFKEKRWVEGNFEYYDDIWGTVWVRVKDGASGGEVFKPVISDWSMLKDLKLPDLVNNGNYDDIKKVYESDKENRYRIFFIRHFLFAICRYMRKMEIYFQDLALERENIDKLHDMVATLLEGVIKKAGATGADGIFFCEDWGIQDRLLIHPDMWREIYKPLYKRLCDAAHSANMHVLMHSCGYNWEILDDLAEVGINAFQFDQPLLYGIERLSEKLQKKKVCLFSPVDIQKVLPTGDKKLITDTAHKMVKLFFGKNGGFIAKDHGDISGIGVKEEWVKWAYDAFLEHC